MFSRNHQLILTYIFSQIDISKSDIFTNQPCHCPPTSPSQPGKGSKRSSPKPVISTLPTPQSKNGGPKEATPSTWTASVTPSPKSVLQRRHKGASNFPTPRRASPPSRLRNRRHRHAQLRHDETRSRGYDFPTKVRSKSTRTLCTSSSKMTTALSCCMVSAREAC